MPDRLLSPKEAAEELGVSVWTVYRLIYRGDLTAIKVGRLLKIPESSIEAYLDLRRVRPKEQGLLMAIEYERRRVK